MTRRASPRPFSRRSGLRAALVALAMGPGPALATAADLPAAMTESWSVHRYLGGAIAQIGAANQGWFAVRCDRADQVGSIAYSAPDAGDRPARGQALDVEVRFDGAPEGIARTLDWDAVEGHWTATFGQRSAIGTGMRRASVMRVTAANGSGAAFALQGVSSALTRMFEICD